MLIKVVLLLRFLMVTRYVPVESGVKVMVDFTKFGSWTIIPLGLSTCISNAVGELEEVIKNVIDCTSSICNEVEIESWELICVPCNNVPFVTNPGDRKSSADKLMNIKNPITLNAIPPTKL